MVTSATVAYGIMSTLVRLGLRDVVVCPGSRSAPLAYAAAEFAERGDLTLHMRIDERSAAYFALGLAVAGGPPAAVITTSGTAVANLVPAVCESDLSHVPLLCITADRPSDQHGCGASQTMEQRTIMGGKIRRLCDVPADLSAPAWQALPSRLGRLWAAAQGDHHSLPGPVHLNVELREPLTGPPQLQDIAAPAHVWMSPEPPLAPPVPAEPRTLIVVGHVPPHARKAALRMVTAAPHPCLVEPTTGLADAAWGAGFVPGGSLVLDSAQWVSENRPARVVMVGRPTLSRAVTELLAHSDTELIIAGAGGAWNDATHRATTVVPLQSFHWSAENDPQTNGYAKTWIDAGTRAVTAARTCLSEKWPHPWLAAAAVVEASSLKNNAVVCGPSNPVRAVDLARLNTECPFFAFRGVAGIDGVLSAAAGIAHRRGGATALVGDLTFLHDHNALLKVSGQSTPPLLIVVMNDDGGGIFEHLEHADAVKRDQFELLFGTATGANIGLLCAATGVQHTLVQSLDELRQEVVRGTQELRVVEVMVPRHGTALVREDIRQAVATAVNGR